MLKSREVILSALLCAVIFSLPNFLMPVLRGDGAYTPLLVKDVNTYAVDQTMLYAPGIRDVMDGHLIANDPAIFENKDRLSFLAPLFPTLFLGIMSVLAGSVQATFMLGSFVFPFIAFILVYFLFYEATKSRNASLLSSFCVSLGFNFIANMPVTAETIRFYLGRLFLNPIEPINYLGRLPHIQFTFILLLLSLIFIYLTLERKKVSYAAAGGIMLGVLFYSYFYYWTAILAAVGILFLVSMAKRDFRTAGNMVVISVVGAVLAAPYIANLFVMASSESYADIGSRLGLESGFEVLLPVKYLAVYLIFAGLTRKRNNFFWLVSSAFMAGIALIIMPVLTGFGIQSRHYDTTLLAPLSAMALVYAFRELSIGDHKRPVLSQMSDFIRTNSRNITLVVALFLVVVSFYSQAAYAFNAYRAFGLKGEYKEVYDWLNENTEKDSVVFTMSVEQNSLIPVYTHNNVFIPNGFFSPYSDEEILERLFIVYRLFGVTPEYLEGLMENGDSARRYNGMRERLEESDQALFESAYWNLYPFHEKFINERIIQSELLGEMDKAGIYKAMLDYYRNFTPDMEKYRIDYMMAGEYERSVSDFEPPSGFRLLWSNEKISIYGRE